MFDHRLVWSFVIIMKNVFLECGVLCRSLNKVRLGDAETCSVRTLSDISYILSKSASQQLLSDEDFIIKPG